MLRSFLPLIIACAVHSLAAQETPEKLKGLLWEVSGNGIAKNGYLYGTMHVPEKLAFNLSDSFFVALRQADVVALETDHDKWQAFTQMLDGRENELFSPQFGAYAMGAASLQPNLYEIQFKFETPENELLGAMLSAKPRLTNEFLYRSNQYRQDYEEDTYLDLFIFQAGRKLGKTVIGLETLEGSYEALVRAQLPDDDAEENDRRYYPGLYSRATMEDAYRDQDLSLMDSLNKMMQPGKNFQRWMLDERNLIMARGIDSVLQSGKSLFSAIGAAHLPGDMGLIKLLRQKGYTLRPVQFSANNSKQEKEAIEALRYPVQFSRQWAADSTWSVEAPGKFYQTVDGQGLEQQLCADMSNGAYYAVYRLYSYGLWNGQSPEYIINRIDSLIYEQIPGRIQEQKRLSDPLPGFEVTTRTRRGDILRYKIVATPMEVLVFAAGGNGDYMGGEMGARFINSVQFHRQQLPARRQPTPFSPPEGGFRLTLPAAPMLNTTGDKDADRYLLATVDPVDSAFYLFYRAEYHDWEYIEEDTFELNIIGEKIAGQFTKEPPVMTLVATAPYPIQDVSFRSDRDSAWYYLRLVIDGPHYYLLGCRKQEPGAPDSYFKSFALQPHHYPKGWEMLPDTNMLFEASMPLAAIKPPTPFLEKLKRIVQEGYQKSKRSGMYRETGPKRLMRVLELPLQGEQVLIQSIEMQPGSMAPSLDSFQSFVRHRILGKEKLVFREQHWDAPDDRLLVGRFLLEDTNSTRGIRARIMVTPGRMYILAATVQLGGEQSAFVDKVFDTFTPTDTTSGILPFGRRKLDFLQDIYASDSLVREKALGRLEQFWKKSVEASDFPAIRAAITHPEFGSLRFMHRNALLQALGGFSSPEALRFVLDLSRRYPDSMRYQQSFLIALAEMQTRPAQEELIRRLRNGSQFVHSATVSAVFEAFNDSLELVVHNLPALLDLTGQDAYRNEVLQLLDKAVQRNLLKSRSYARLKKELIRDAYNKLGQQAYAAEIKRDASMDEDRYMMGGYYMPYGDSDTDLERPLRLLAPFLRSDKQVQTLFAQATHSPDKEVQITAWSLTLEQKQAVDPLNLLAFADDDRTRYMLYRHLVDAGQLDSYRSWFADTVALVRAMLVEDMSKHDNDREAAPDSIRFISRHRTLQWGSPAMVYFFEVKQKKDKNWLFAYVTVSLNSQIFGVQARETDKNDELEDYSNPYWQRPEVKIMADIPEKEREEFIRKKVGEVRFANRARYQYWNAGGDYFYEE